MTMKIEVQIPHERIEAGSAVEYLAAAMLAIGFQRGVSLAMPAAADKAAAAAVADMHARLAAASAQATAEALEDTADEKVDGVTNARQPATETEAPKRERGKPAPGRARRTKEEIAEDEAADKAEAPPAEEAPLISTGEERIDPTTIEDAAQDAADEAAEVEATKAPELTHDDVRAALQKYLTAYGTPAAMEDGPKVLTMMFGAEVAKVSAVPADQASLAKAIAGIDEMLVKNPFNREAQL